MSNLDRFQDAINSAIRSNKYDPVTVVTKNHNFYSISRARLYKGRQFGNSKLYTDIILDTNRRSIRIALKEDVIKETNIDRKVIELIVPGLIDRFLRNIGTKIKSLKLDEGAMLPSMVFGKINRFHKNRLIEGIQSVGGPIDYVYEGSVVSEYDDETRTVNFEGTVRPIEDYAQVKQVYLQIERKKDQDKYTSELKTSDIQKMYDPDTIRVVETTPTDILIDLS